jgi:hypothetical protein
MKTNPQTGRYTTFGIIKQPSRTTQQSATNTGCCWSGLWPDHEETDRSEGDAKATAKPERRFPASARFERHLLLWDGRSW